MSEIYGGEARGDRSTELENLNPDDLEKQLTKFEEINRKSKEYEYLVGKVIDHEEYFDPDTFKLLFQDEDNLPSWKNKLFKKIFMKNKSIGSIITDFLCY